MPRRDPTPEQLALFAEHAQWCSLHVLRFGRWRARAAGIDSDDLMQAARMGLWRAILTFDPSRGIKLATHCRKHIWGHLHECVEVARFGRRRRRWRPLIDHSAFARLSDDAICRL